MLEVADVDDIFAPVSVDEMCVRISDPTSRGLLESALSMLYSVYEKQKSVGCALGAATQVASEILVRNMNIAY